MSEQQLEATGTPNEETVDTVTEVVQDGVTVQQPGTVTATATRKVE